MSSVAAFAAWFALCVFPVRLPTPTTDPSWQAVLNYAAVHHLQFGTDLVFTYGPLGYLMQNQYCPGTWWQVVLFQVLSRAMYLVLLWRSIRLQGMPADGTKAWHLIFVILAAILPVIDSDSFYLLFITFLGANLLRATKPGWFEFGGVALAAAMALTKGTCLAFDGLMLACVLVRCVMNSQKLRGVLLLGTFVAALLFSWRVIGHQQLAHLPSWLKSVKELTNAYQLSMGVAPEPNQLACGIMVFLIVAAALVGAWAQSRNSFLTLLLMAAGLFLAWKQSFIRAHVFYPRTFFIYALVVTASLPLYAGFLFNRLAFIFLFGVSLGNGLLIKLPLPLYRAFENARFLVRLPNMAGLYAENAQAYDLPQTRKLVGTNTVDVIGTEQAIAILNGLDYHPAPVFQTYAACTPGLAALNARFYRSDQAPNFVILSPPEYRVDDRMPNLDASISGLVIHQRYEQVFEERHYRLLKLTGPSHPPSGPEIQGKLNLGERLGVHGGNWCEVVMKENLVGRLMRILWASPPVYVDAWANQPAPVRYRFVPSLGQAGFLVPAEATGIAVSQTAAARWCFQRELGYKIYRGDSQ
jgi:hypothetical protein